VERTACFVFQGGRCGREQDPHFGNVRFWQSRTPTRPARMKRRGLDCGYRPEAELHPDLNRTVAPVSFWGQPDSGILSMPKEKSRQRTKSQ
jgi:hypothetical protein